MLSKAEISVGIMGCGRVANHYKKILKSEVVEGLKLVAVCDINLVKAIEYASDFNVPFFDSIETMMDEIRLDLIIVLTPSGFHYLHSKQILESGISVLVEKPAAMLPTEISEVESLARSKNLMYAVVFQNRLNRAVLRLNDAVKRGRFGRIVSVSIRLKWCRYDEYYADGWHGTWALDGGVLNQQAIHHVDVMNWIFGPIKSVIAKGDHLVNTLEAEDTLVALVEFEDASLGTIEVTTAARPRDFEASISVTGTGGSAKVGGIALNTIEEWDFVQDEITDADVKLLSSELVETGYGNSHAQLIQLVVDEMRVGSTKPPIEINSVVATTALIHSIYASEEVGTWVAVEDFKLSKRLGRKEVKENS
jgi:UDP-N-acetyl-2-amino-2-deoxyglucuronate dehydrogenase